ncbi:LuxR C-terminal-related transcriptional regulator [Gordonia sp. NPDC003585]|uniref:helix-turn-helix transcriptional regulator n=1 Tax=Gordonia sp. NPDC003585 TaxID=3154275 RepID=UPI0033BBB39B
MGDALSGSVVAALRRIKRDSGVPLAFGGVVLGPRALRLDHFAGDTVGALNGVSVDIGHGLGGKVVAVNRPMVVDDYLKTPRITHRYNTIIAREGLRAMAAAPVIVDRKPVAVLYGALRAADPIGGRTLDVLAMEARAVEQEIVAARIRMEAAADRADAAGDSVAAAYARLRVLAATSGDRRLAEELDRITDDLASNPVSAQVFPSLTSREQDVLSLAALGYPNARIAAELGITVETTKGYVKAAMRKLDAATRFEAVVTARRAGLLP